MKRVIHHVKRHGISFHNHIVDHHKKYIFGLISAGLIYKAVSLIIAAFFVQNIGPTFADSTGDLTDTGVVQEIEVDGGELIEETDDSLIDDSNDELIDETNDELTDETNDELIDETDDELTDESEVELIGSGGIESDTGSVGGDCNLGDLSLISPISGEILAGEFDIIWQYNNSDCSGKDFIVKLWDANTQYVVVGTASYNNTGISFDSSLLFSGFYNITGLNLSGEIEVIYTGQYSGYNTTYFTGHKIAILSSDQVVVYEGDYFTIDNKKPTLDNLTLSTTGINSGYIGLNSEVELSFTSSEEITGVVVNILGTYATINTKSGNNYVYYMDLSTGNTEGNIIYNIEYEDLAGNTGYSEGVSNIKFDRTKPALTLIVFTATGDDISLNLRTDELSTINFIYSMTGIATGKSLQTTYLTSYNYLLTGINSGTYYNYTLSAKDFANNITYIGGYFKSSGDDIVFTQAIINSGDMMVGIGFNTGVENTGEFLGKLRMEIEKFNSCKESIGDINNINLPVRGYTTIIQMPDIEKSYVKKLISAFSVVLYQRVEQAGLTQDSIDKVTSEFNDFLVILKLVRDDDNQCEQNLSNYYMSKFKNTLIRYNLTIN